MLVFDLTNHKSFESVEKWKAEIKAIKEIPVNLVGNKYDLEEQREVTSDELTVSMQQTKCKVFETSAMTGYNVETAFKNLVY